MPTVQREQRRLDRERGHEAEEQPVARALPARGQVEGSLREPQHDHRREHQKRARHRVDDELDRRAEPPRAAPDADQDVQRQQHRLPEDVEEEQVLRGEDADDRGGQQQHQTEVSAGSGPAGPEGVSDRRRLHDHRQADEPERKAVHADVVRDVEVAEPVRPLVELEAAAVEVEPDQRLDPDSDLRECDQQRDRAGRERVPREQPDEERAAERNQDQRRRQPAHRLTSPPRRRS